MSRIIILIEDTGASVVRGRLQVDDKSFGYQDEVSVRSICHNVVVSANALGVSELIYDGPDTPVTAGLAHFFRTVVETYEEYELPVEGLAARCGEWSSKSCGADRLSIVSFDVRQHSAIQSMLVGHSLITDLQADRLDSHQNPISIIAFCGEVIVGGILARMEGVIAFDILRVANGSKSRRALINRILVQEFVKRLQRENVQVMRYTVNPESAVESRNLSFRSGGKQVGKWRRWLFFNSSSR